MSSYYQTEELRLSLCISPYVCFRYKSLCVYFEHKMLYVSFQYKHAWIPASTYLLGTVALPFEQKIVRGDTKGVYIHPHCFSYTMEQPSEISEPFDIACPCCQACGARPTREPMPANSVVGYVARLVAEDRDTSYSESCR